MAHDAIEVNAVVREALPNALYRVEPEEGGQGPVVAHLAAGSALLRLRPGDAVVVALEAYDMTRGRIVRRRS